MGVDERIFLDANVLVYAFKGQGPLAEHCLQILDTPGSIFLSSAFLKLELLPIPCAFKQEKERLFLESFFGAAEAVESSLDDIVRLAEPLAFKYGLGAMDALHVSTAIWGKAGKFFTVEKPTKPLCKVTEIQIISLYKAQPASD